VLALLGGCSYSDGDRTGYLQKLSSKGWLCMTYEGELAMTIVPGVPRPSGPSVCGTTTWQKYLVAKWGDESSSIIGSYALSPPPVSEKPITSWIVRTSWIGPAKGGREIWGPVEIIVRTRSRR
jgi:hypothetical protein